VLVAAVLVAITTIWLGVGIWADFWTAWRNGEPACQVMSAATFRCAFGPVGGAVGYALTGLLLFGAYRVRRDDAAFALMSLAMVVPAPDLWPHYLLLPLVGFLPFGIRTIRRALQPSRHEGQSRASGDTV
jgi:hypothetical protein